MMVVKKTCHSFLYSWRFRTLSLPFIWTELASKLQTRECKLLCLFELLFFALYICFTFTRLLEAMYQHRLGFITRIFKFHFESKIEFKRSLYIQCNLINPYRFLNSQYHYYMYIMQNTADLHCCPKIHIWYC